jgi:molybdenum cofactor cytidylyltransferase
MGAPKALLTYRGETFLGRLVRALSDGGCQPILVVVGPADGGDAERIAAEAATLGATVVVNPDPGSEQVESLRTALRALPAGVEGILATPVDAPGATAEVVSALLAAAAPRIPIVVPSFGGRRGHPILFGRRVFAELLSAELEAGARTLIARYEEELVEVAVEDAGVLLDIDTPAEYRRLTEGEG